MINAVNRAGIGAGRLSAGLMLGLLALTQAQGAQLTIQPAGNEGFDVYANGVLVAPIRLAANGAIVADNVVSNAAGLLLSGLRTTDPLAITFATNDFVSVTLPAPGDTNTDPVVQFHLTLGNFNTNALPLVPAMNDLGWIPGHVHLTDFAGPIGVTLYGAGSETAFYPAGKVLLNGWRGQS